MNRPSKQMIRLLLAVVILAVAGYLIWRVSPWYLDGTYYVRDQFVDTTGIELASVSFVGIDDYDSAHVRRIAEDLAGDAVESGTLNSSRRRSFLYHFFVDGDTAALTDAMIDELAYAHPTIHEPERRLLFVPNGWVVKATYAPGKTESPSIDCHQVPFYMARPGVRAKDLQ